VNWLKKLFAKEAQSAPTQTIKVRGGTISLFPTKAESAQSEWQRRRKSSTGSVVILIDPDDHSEMREDAEDGVPAEILAQAATIDLPTFFAGRREDLGLDEDEEVDEDWVNEHQEPDPAKLVRAKTPINRFAGAEQSQSAYLAEIPCQAPWQVLAHYAFGGWNDVPYDHELTAVFKSWYERFGAVPALIAGDVIELWVDRPVEDPAVAAKLAMEMYELCPDAVDQGYESTEALANAILGANVWYFWWD